MILFVASKKDIAATNIANQLLVNHDFDETDECLYDNPVHTKKLNEETAKLAFIETESVNTQSLVFPPQTRLIIFLSRHSSKSGTLTLSVHAPGNLGEADLGGLPRTVSIAPACAMKEALKVMNEARDEMSLGYEVSYECTHDGPSLNLPFMFVELGSSIEQWRDPDAAEAVARGALAAAYSKNVYPVVGGIGGPHYNNKFTRKALSSAYAFGHIIPNYAINRLDAEVLKQCIIRTLEPVKKIMLDWKGIRSADKVKILDLLGEINLDIEKI